MDPVGRKPRIATVWLGGCSGCHMSFLDMDEGLIDSEAAMTRFLKSLPPLERSMAQSEGRLYRGYLKLLSAKHQVEKPLGKLRHLKKGALTRRVKAHAC